VNKQREEHAESEVDRKKGYIDSADPLICHACGSFLLCSCDYFMRTQGDCKRIQAVQTQDDDPEMMA
jgi:hypothetical protein